jgi:hypothetical protein
MSHPESIVVYAYVKKKVIALKQKKPHLQGTHKNVASFALMLRHFLKIDICKTSRGMKLLPWSTQ